MTDSNHVERRSVSKNDLLFREAVRHCMKNPVSRVVVVGSAYYSELSEEEADSIARLQFNGKDRIFYFVNGSRLYGFQPDKNLSNKLRGIELGGAYVASDARLSAEDEAYLESRIRVGPDREFVTVNLFRKGGAS